MRSLVIWTVAAALAILAAIFALGRATEFHNPAVSIALPLKSGIGEAQAAELILGQHMASGGTSHVSLPPAAKSEVLRLSHSALAREPLASAALSNLALIAAADGRVVEARKLMRDAERLTRRNIAANGWLIRDYALKGELQSALGAYDHALRTSAAGQQRLLAALIDSLANQAMIAPATRLLRGGPPWADAFWQEAPRHTAALHNVAVMRIELARLHAAQPSHDRDSALLNALAHAREFSAAEDLVHFLAKSQPAEGEVLRNGGFDEPSRFEPFDWHTFFSSTMSADLQPEAGVLKINTYSDGSGIVARQAVALRAPRYILRVRAKDWDKLDRTALHARLRCADQADAAQSEEIALPEAEVSAMVPRPSAKCLYYWFEIYADAQPERQDNTITLDQVSLRAVQQ